MEYDINKFQRKIKNINKKKSYLYPVKSIYKFAQGEDYIYPEINYKDWLKLIGKNLEIYPTTWDHTKKLLSSFLENSPSIPESNEVLDYLNSFKGKVEGLKRNQGLSEDDIKELQQISVQPQEIELQRICDDVQTRNVAMRIDLDKALLVDRISYCERIYGVVKDQLKALLVSESKVVRPEDFLFAPLKQLERSETKLKEYASAVERDEQGHVRSAAYRLKDLLRCSVVCDTPEEARKVVKVLANTSAFRVFEFKNGFADKVDKAGQVVQHFDRSQYADLKLVLCTPGPAHPDFDFDELVEVQVIQRVNIEIKKLEHKLYDFEREREGFLEQAAANAKLDASLGVLRQASDQSSASLDEAYDLLNHSRLGAQAAVMQELKVRRPHIYSYLPYELQVMAESLAGVEYAALTRQLQLLQPFIASLRSFRIDKREGLYEVRIRLSETLTVDFAEHLKRICDDETYSDKSTLKYVQTMLATEAKRNLAGQTQLVRETLQMQLVKYTEIVKIEGHKSDVDCLAVAPDGSTLFSGSGDCVKAWDAKTGAELRTLTGHKGTVYCLAVAPDGSTLFSGSSDRCVKAWDAKTGAELRTLTGHKGYVNCLAVAPDGSTLFSGSWDKIIVNRYEILN